MLKHYVPSAPKQSIESVAKRIGQFLSDEDMHRFLGTDTPIVKYSQLKYAPNIEVLLPDPQSQIIILVESELNSGHWCAIARDGFIITTFDSYGCKVDAEMNFISQKMKTLLGEKKDEIQDLLKRSPGFTHEYNKEKFQSLKKVYGTVPATCGRWVVLFIWFMRQNYDLKAMQAYMEHLKEDTDFPYDFLICLLVK